MKARTLQKTSLLCALVMLLAPAAAVTDGGTDTRDQAIEMLRTAHRQRAAAQYDSVVTTLAELLSLQPTNQDAYYYSALAHIALGDTAQALTVLTEGAEQAPLSSRIKLMKVRLHLIAGETDIARELLNAVKMFKPNNAEAMYLEGRLALVEGDSTRALELWEAALKRAGRDRR